MCLLINGLSPASGGQLSPVESGDGHRLLHLEFKDFPEKIRPAINRKNKKLN